MLFPIGSSETAVLLREPAPKTVSDSNFRSISLLAFSKRMSSWDLNPVFPAVQIGTGNWGGRMNVTWWVSDAWAPCTMNEMVSAGVSLLKVDVLRRLTVRDVAT